MSRDCLIKQPDGVGRIVAEIDRRIGTNLAVSHCRGHGVPLCDWRRSFQGFGSALEESLGIRREGLLQESLKILPVDVTLAF